MPKDVSTRCYAVINGKERPSNIHEYQYNASNYYGAADDGAGSVSTASASQNTSYPSNSLNINIPNSSAYADVGIQCESISSPGMQMEIVHSTTLTAPVTVRPELRETSNMQAGVKLSEEQLTVLHMVNIGYNIFFTGPAGTGKSVLLREIISHLRHNRKKDVAVTAPTGIAGINIGGSTIHSWAGIGLGKEPEDVLVARIKGSKLLRKRWNKTNVLVIDEISMLDGVLFDKLEYIARFVRSNQRPFGGIQLVLCGDFFQLPPVPDKTHNYQMPATFAFDAVSWPKCISRPVFLSQVFRQKDDTFIFLLTSIRCGNLTTQDIDILDSLKRPLHFDNGIEPTQLFPRRYEVENCNNRHLSNLQGEEMTYNSMDSAGWDVRRERIPKDAAERLLNHLVAPPAITLKAGAQVMLISNITQGSLVNGSVGKVVEFLTHHEAMKRLIQIVDPRGRSEDSEEGLYASPHRYRSKADRQKLQESKLPEAPPGLTAINDNVFSKHQRWPLVEFPNGNMLLCSPMPFSVQGFMGNTEAHRMQVPLILAWALSIHKSQGQTLNRVKIDLSNAFESGQAYVALSRATSLEGLELVNFDLSKIMAHERVIAWNAECLKQQHTLIEKEMDSEEAISQFWSNPL